jgi:hypothetical protein
MTNIYVWWGHCGNNNAYAAHYMAARLRALCILSRLPSKDVRVFGPGIGNVTWNSSTGEVISS